MSAFDTLKAYLVPTAYRNRVILTFTVEMSKGELTKLMKRASSDAILLYYLGTDAEHDDIKLIDFVDIKEEV